MELKLELNEALGARLAEAAAGRHLTPQALVTEVLQWHLVDAEAMEAGIAEGEADVAAGRVFSHEKVMQELRGIIAAARSRQGG